MSFACTTGEVIQEFALTAEHEFRHGAPYIRIHRADYHNLLAVRAPRIKPDVIHLDHRVVGFVEPIFFEPSIPRSGFDLFLGKFRRCEYLETVHSAPQDASASMRAIGLFTNKCSIIAINSRTPYNRLLQSGEIRLIGLRA